MKIVLCEPTEHPRIAYEDQDGSREGEFFLDSQGVVRYSHPGDGHVWFAAPKAASFLEAVDSWEAYLVSASLPDTTGRAAALDNLRSTLTRLDLLQDRVDALWPVLLEQAEAGLL